MFFAVVIKFRPENQRRKWRDALIKLWAACGGQTHIEHKPHLAMRADGCTRACRQSMSSKPTQCFVETAAIVRCNQERAQQLLVLGCALTCMLILYERHMLTARSDDDDASCSLWPAPGGEADA